MSIGHRHSTRSSSDQGVFLGSSSNQYVWLYALGMFLGALIAGAAPMLCRMSPNKLRIMSIYGSGLLVGVVFLIVIPEGLSAVYGSTSELRHQLENLRRLQNDILYSADAYSSSSRPDDDSSSRSRKSRHSSSPSSYSSSFRGSDRKVWDPTGEILIDANAAALSDEDALPRIELQDELTDQDFETAAPSSAYSASLAHAEDKNSAIAPALGELVFGSDADVAGTVAEKIAEDVVSRLQTPAAENQNNGSSTGQSSPKEGEKKNESLNKLSSVSTALPQVNSDVNNAKSSSPAESENKAQTSMLKRDAKDAIIASGTASKLKDTIGERSHSVTGLPVVASKPSKTETKLVQTDTKQGNKDKGVAQIKSNPPKEPTVEIKTSRASSIPSSPISRVALSISESESQPNQKQAPVVSPNDAQKAGAEKSTFDENALLSQLLQGDGSGSAFQLDPNMSLEDLEAMDEFLGNMIEGDQASKEVPLKDLKLDLPKMDENEKVAIDKPEDNPLPLDVRNERKTRKEKKGGEESSRRKHRDSSYSSRDYSYESDADNEYEHNRSYERESGYSNLQIDKEPVFDAGSYVGRALIAGFVLMYIVERLFMGSDHGHGHGHGHGYGNDYAHDSDSLSSKNVLVQKRRSQRTSDDTHLLREQETDSEVSDSPDTLGRSSIALKSIQVATSSDELNHPNSPSQNQPTSGQSTDDENSSDHDSQSVSNCKAAVSSILLAVGPSTLSLLVHNAADGFALGAAGVNVGSGTRGFALFMAMLLHKVPMSFGVFSVLVAKGYAHATLRKYLIVFSLVAPVFAIATSACLNLVARRYRNGALDEGIIGLSILFSAGSLIYTIGSHLIPELQETSRNSQKRMAAKTKRSLLSFIADYSDVFLLIFGCLTPLIFIHNH